MSKEMIISSSRHETKIALTEDGLVVEVYVEREKEVGLVGSIYKGRVTRVLPGMQSAFVDIGLDRDAFLYVSDFSENLEGYDHAPATRDEAEETTEDSAPGDSADGDKEKTSSPRRKTARRSRRSRVTRRGRKPGTATEGEEVTAPPAEEGPAANAETPEPGTETETATETPAEATEAIDAGQAAREDTSGETPGKEIVAAAEPELELPEKRPAGRTRSSRPRPRGGRGRGTRGAGRGSRRPSSNAPAQPGKGEIEPVVLLPGESIAMYRDQPSQDGARRDAPEERTPTAFSAPPAESATPLKEAAPETAGETPAPTLTTPVGAASPGETETTESPAATGANDVTTAPEEETVNMTEVAPEPSAEEVTEPVADETEAETPEAESATAEAETSPEETGTLDEYLTDAISTGTRDELDDALTELQRFRSYQDEVGLPPSVRERTDDGVEWHGDDEETEDGATTEITGEGDAVPAQAEATEAAEAAEDGEKKPAARRRRITRGGRGRGTRSKSATDKTDKTGTKDSESEDAAPGTRSRSASTRTGSRTAGRRSSARGNGRRTSRSRTGASRPATRRRTSARPSQGQPAIAELLKAGQEIIIQIAKSQIGQKGARITSHVTLPGRYLVYMPTIDHIGVSRKIGTADERARLRRTLIEMKGKAAGGFVVRTAAADCTDEELQADVDYLVRLWYGMIEKSESQRSPVILHQDLDLVQRLLRDQLSRSYENVWIDNEEEYTRVAEFVGKFLPKLSSKVKLYTRAEDIFEEMGVQQEIDRALRPKVWLKSGGYIVVNQTEALVAIDINTGKFVGKGSTRLEDTIVKTNIEAVKEIVRQVRLRDLGGIIVIDFIDMEDRRNRTKVMRALENALQVDRQPSKILPFNEFGLVAITRKRSKQSLERILCQPCPYCTGTGMLRSIQTLCIEIQNEARKMALEMDAPELTIRANPDIVAALKGEVSGLVDELEEEFDKNIILQADESLHFEHYNIF